MFYSSKLRSFIFYTYIFWLVKFVFGFIFLFFILCICIVLKLYCKKININILSACFWIGSLDPGSNFFLRFWSGSELVGWFTLKTKLANAERRKILIWIFCLIQNLCIKTSWIRVRIKLKWGIRIRNKTLQVRQTGQSSKSYRSYIEVILIL